MPQGPVPSMSFSPLVYRGPDIQFPTLTIRTNLHDNNDIKGSHAKPFLPMKLS
jgi:hypothetical protein